MKILGTVSRRSKGKIVIELFQFRGLLMVWDLTASQSFDRYLQRERVTGA
jgi:hypothetical protein